MLLDELRRVLAIDADVLTPDFLDRLRKLVPRAPDRRSGPCRAPSPTRTVGIAIPEPGNREGGPRHRLDRDRPRARTADGCASRERFGAALNVATADEVIRALFDRADHAWRARRGHASRATRLSAEVGSAMLLRAGDGDRGSAGPGPSPLRGRERPARGARSSATCTPTPAATWPVWSPPSTPRRCARTTARAAEQAFRSGSLPLLFCSPTMELGVDISSLNAVGHAQRAAHARPTTPSGRAAPAAPGSRRSW